uniref:Uncharacterized protein n=1 Tax=Solanum tuberosum TaxID=4113 RepID=M1BR83_SOLTU
MSSSVEGGMLMRLFAQSFNPSSISFWEGESAIFTIAFTLTLKTSRKSCIKIYPFKNPKNKQHPRKKMQSQTQQRLIIYKWGLCLEANLGTKLAYINNPSKL